MKKKSKIIIIVVIAVLLIATGLIIYFTSDNNYSSDNKNNDIQKMSDKEAREYLENLTDIIINGGTRKELIEALKTDEIPDSYIMTGEDMYLLQKPADEIIKTYSLDNYVTASKDLAERLETAIQNNFEYSINEITSSDDYTSVNISYRTYYYTAYINDLTQIRNTLLTRAGYNLETINYTEQFEADLYKAKIKAASILDNYLNNYINENEVNNTIVSYTNNSIDDSGEEFMSYLINLTGFTYSNAGNLVTDDDLTSFLANYDLTDPLAL